MRKPSRPVPTRRGHPPGRARRPRDGPPRPSSMHRAGCGRRASQAAGPQAPGDLALNTPPPTIEDWNQQLPPPDSFAGPEEGYTVEEIRDATRGFFGTISTNLAAVLEHAFRIGGGQPPTFSGMKAGGAFLAGLRYGKGQLYMRSGLSAQVYWHGPSLGYDFGAEGSRTMFLIYSLRQPGRPLSPLYRRRRLRLPCGRGRRDAAQRRSGDTCADPLGRRPSSRCEYRLRALLSRADMEPVLISPNRSR